jgi:hypothetical protein
MIKPPEPKIRSYLVCGILPILLRRKSEDVRARVLACEGQRTFYFPRGDLRLFFGRFDELDPPWIKYVAAIFDRAPGSLNVAGRDSQKDSCRQCSTTSPRE